MQRAKERERERGNKPDSNEITEQSNPRESSWNLHRCGKLFAAVFLSSFIFFVLHFSFDFFIFCTSQLEDGKGRKGRKGSSSRARRGKIIMFDERGCSFRPFLFFRFFCFRLRWTGRRPTPSFSFTGGRKRDTFIHSPRNLFYASL